MKTTEKLEKHCKQCGVSFVVNCPVTEEDFCEKRKNITCPNCQFVELDEDYPTKCNFPNEND